MNMTAHRTARKTAKVAEIRTTMNELQDSLRLAITDGDVAWEAELRLSLAVAEEELNEWLDS